MYDGAIVSVCGLRGDICNVDILPFCEISRRQWLPMRNGISPRSSYKTPQVEDATSTPTKSFPIGNRPPILFRTWAKNCKCILVLCLISQIEHATFTKFLYFNTLLKDSLHINQRNHYS